MPLSTSTPLASPPALASAGGRRFALAASALVALALLCGVLPPRPPSSAEETDFANQTGSTAQSPAASRASQNNRLRLQGPWGSSLSVGGSVGGRLSLRRPAWKLRLHFALELNPFGDN
jgi:hypothetical protein